MENFNGAMDTLTIAIKYGSLSLLAGFVTYLIIRAAVCHGIKDSKDPKGQDVTTREIN